MSQASCTNAGGVGFYVKNNLGYIHRSDLSGRVQNDYESLWIEIQTDTGHNTIFFIDPPPLGNLDNFLNHINMIAERIHRENKYCFIRRFQIRHPHPVQKIS